MGTTAQAPYGFASSKQAYNGPDPYMVRYQTELLQGFYKRVGPTEFAARAFWILRKNPEEGEKDILPTTSRFWNRRLVPFVHNRIQRDLDQKIIVDGSLRNIMLKPRQAGYTTWSIIMRLLLPAILSPGTGAMLVSQNAEYASAHFDILKLAWTHFFKSDPFNAAHPDNDWANSLKQHLLHVRYSNRRELIFDQIESRVRCASAEVEEAGQGLTLQHVVATEVSRWEHKPEETLANIKEAIPKEGTLDIECTPNGMGGYFYEEYNRAINPGAKKREFKPHFHTWWWHDEYRKVPGVAVPDLTNEERSLVMAYGLDGEQIAWRREKMESLRHNFAEKYPEDDITCFLTSGSLFFEKEILQARYRELQSYTPAQVFNKFQVFKKAVKHREYVIGADPASGIPVTSENPDYSAAVVIDLETGEEMAAYRAHVLPQEFAQDLADLGRMYNNAQIAVERLNEGGTVIMSLEVENQYMNLYKHRDWWRKDLQNIKEVKGFPTNQRNRPIALNRIRWFVAESPHLIYDKIFIGEALSFIREEKKGKPEAQKGAHDDTVLCRAIAYYCRNVRNGYLDPSAIRRRERYGDTPTEYMAAEEKEQA